MPKEERAAFRSAWPCILLMLAAGCVKPPDTLAANPPAQGYTPIDPLPVMVVSAEPNPSRTQVLNALPDETMRLAVADISAGGAVSYGPASVAMEGRTYKVVLDWTKFTTNSIGVDVLEEPDTPVQVTFAIAEPDVLVPVYVGVGLRMIAQVRIIKGEVNIGSLSGLGLAANANALTGSLTIQTLGITGPEITSLLPMPSKIDDTSIQNALVALASIKAKLYDDKTSITPRVVGVHNSIGGGAKTIQVFTNQLLKTRIAFSIESGAKGEAQSLALVGTKAGDARLAAWEAEAREPEPDESGSGGPSMDPGKVPGVYVAPPR